MKGTDQGVRFVVPFLIPLRQTQFTLPFDFSGESQEHLRQVIQHLAARVVNHSHQ